MNVRTFKDEVPAWLSSALEDFEREFTYPLGAGSRFRISHGRDYLRFFRAMGDAACVVAESDGKVLGTLSGAIVSLDVPGGTLPALYIGDLKVTSGARGTRVFFVLARAIEDWARDRAAAAFAVVMDGTDLTPNDYSGRAGIPKFEPVSKQMLLRIDGAASRKKQPKAERLEAAAALPLAKSFASNRIAHLSGRPGLRARFEPEWRRLGNAVCCVEDTLAAKQLVALDGTEIASTHLSCFAWKTHEDAAALLASIASDAGERPRSIFAAVEASDAEPVRAALRAIDAPLADATALLPATVFAHGAPAVGWLVNPSEI